MTSWIGKALGSSLGRKYLVAASGLLLVGFLVAHLLGNLNLLVDTTGGKFNQYAHFLETNPLLPVAEIGLAALFVLHVGMAITVTYKNRRSRASRYAVAGDKGKRTLASSSMIVTGLVVLVFLIIHLVDFRFTKDTAEAVARYGSNREMFDLASMVRARLASPVGATIYLIAVLVLGVHLTHAIRSAAQSLGVNHPNLNTLIVRGGIALAILLTLGFASFPIYYMFQGAH